MRREVGWFEDRCNFGGSIRPSTRKKYLDHLFSVGCPFIKKFCYVRTACNGIYDPDDPKYDAYRVMEKDKDNKYGSGCVMVRTGEHLLGMFLDDPYPEARRLDRRIKYLYNMTKKRCE